MTEVKRTERVKLSWQDARWKAEQTTGSKWKLIQRQSTNGSLHDIEWGDQSLSNWQELRDALNVLLEETGYEQGDDQEEDDEA